MSAMPTGPAHAQPPTLTDRMRLHPAVWAIGALNTLMWLVAEGRGGSTDLRVMLELGAQATPLLDAEPWRLLTSTFLHFGLIHLASNMFGLYLFGQIFEELVGSRRFAALYLAAGLAGSATTVVFVGSNTVSAGASGSIFGLLGAFAVLGFQLRETPQGQAWLRQAGVLFGLNLVLGLSSPSIGLEAHAGGAVAGAVIFAAYAGRRGPRSFWADRHRGTTTRGLSAAIIVAVLSVAIALLAA